MRRLFAACAIMILCPSLLRASPPDGYWTGSASIGASGWPIAVSFEAQDDGPAAFVDISQLGMFRQPVALSEDDAGVWKLEFPFGLGAVGFAPGSDAASEEFSLSPEITLAIALERGGDAPPYAHRDVSFESEGVTLAGTVFTPSDASGVGVAIVHGSGVGSRDAWESRRWVNMLLERGATVLVYDRRGEGLSSAPAEMDTEFRGLASDAAAAARELASLESIDPGRVGLMGGSQACWVAARAATEHDGIAFLILNGLPSVSPAQQERQSVEHRARRLGLSGADVQHALTYLDLYFYVARTGAGFDLLASAAADAQQAAWGELVDQPRSLDDLAWWGRHASFDMYSRLASLEIPLLALWGDGDVVTPPCENLGRAAAAFDGRPNGLITTRVCPGVGHALETNGMRFGSDGEWVWPRLSPTAVEAIDDFLRTHVAAD